MKICMIFPLYAPNYQADGVGDYTCILVEKLRERGHDVHVIASGLYKGKDERVIRIGGGKWRFRELKEVFRKIRKEKFEVVHMQYTPTSYGFGVSFKFLPLLVRLGAPGTLFVTTFHTLVGGRWISRINALLLAAFSREAISTNEEITFLYKKWMPFFADKLRQIPIGANVPSCSSGGRVTKDTLMKKFGIQRESVIIGHFGFTNPGKGLEDVVTALYKLKSRDKYHLLVIGAVRQEDVEYQEYIRKLIRMRGIDKYVIWAGEMAEDQVSDFLKATDMYLVPYSEGISIRRGSLMAAIVNGLPTISTFPRVEMPYFKNGENVVLVERGNPDQIADAIVDLAKDEDKRKKISDNIAKLAGQFDWDTIAGKTEKVYESVKTKGRGGTGS